MKNYEEMNAPEKIIYNAIENYIPINEVVKTLCDLFIEIDEKEKDLYNSKMDKFLKLNFLTETSFEKKHKELLLFNHFSLINAISTTFNTDINLTHYLKYDFTDYIEFQREILSIKKNKNLTINEILKRFDQKIKDPRRASKGKNVSKIIFYPLLQELDQVKFCLWVQWIITIQI